MPTQPWGMKTTLSLGWCSGAFMNEQYLLKMSHKEEVKEPFVDQWWLVFGWKTVISPILCIPGYEDDDSDANSSATSMGGRLRSLIGSASHMDPCGYLEEHPGWLKLSILPSAIFQPEFLVLPPFTPRPLQPP